MFEQVGKRTTKRTSTFWGWDLKLFWELPFYDERLEAAAPDASPEPLQAEQGRRAVEAGAEGDEERREGDEETAAPRKVELLRGTPSIRRLKHVSYNVKVRADAIGARSRSCGILPLAPSFSLARVSLEIIGRQHPKKNNQRS